MARTKLTIAEVRNPISRVRSTRLLDKLNDLDDLLDAQKTTVYSAAGAISPSDSLAIINAAVAAQAMTLANGTVTGERINIVLRSGTSAKITPAAFTGGTEILLTAGSPRCSLVWTGSAWDATNAAGSEHELAIAGHGQVTGAGPFYIASSDTIPAGATALTPYWLIVLDAGSVQLASSPANAAAGTAITLTSAGSGTITLTKLISITSVDDAADEFTKVAHGVADETKVRIEAGAGGVLPAPLVTATDYWAIVDGVDAFQLAASLVDAQADSAIDLSTEGTLPLNLLHLAFLTVSAVDFAS